MRALSDTLLDSGCAAHIETLHGESIRILSGPDAGKTFYAVKETKPDSILLTDISEDRRGVRTISFRDSNAVPQAVSQCEVETADGKKWKMTRAPQDGYLTTDFELQQIVEGKDT